MLSSVEWHEFGQRQKDIIESLMIAIIQCKQNNIEAIEFEVEPFIIYSQLSRFCEPALIVNCDECEDVCIASCEHCGGSIFNIAKKERKITCENCGWQQTQQYIFQCEDGHPTGCNNINECLVISLDGDFYSMIRKTLNTYYPELSFPNGEFITVRNNTLEIYNPSTYAKLLPSDIAGFDKITSRVINEGRARQLTKILEQFKEKCKVPSGEKCTKCKYSNIDTINDLKCLIKLFEVFDGFQAQPHQGHEFGDVPLLIKYGGQNITFQGIAKSIPSLKDKKVTRGSKTGREIIEQTLSALIDQRVEITGIIYPYILDAQLQHLLFHYAKLKNKKLVILDYDFILKLTDYYLELKNFEIDIA